MVKVPLPKSHWVLSPNQSSKRFFPTLSASAFRRADTISLSFFVVTPDQPPKRALRALLFSRRNAARCSPPTSGDAEQESASFASTAALSRLIGCHRKTPIVKLLALKSNRRGARRRGHFTLAADSSQKAAKIPGVARVFAPGGHLPNCVIRVENVFCWRYGATAVVRTVREKTLCGRHLGIPAGANATSDLTRQKRLTNRRQTG